MVIEYNTLSLLALTAIATISGLFTALMFVLLNPRSERLPRWAAYVAGVGTILTAFALLRVAVYGDWKSVAELAVIILAVAAVPTLGRIWMLYQDSLAHRREEHQRRDVMLAKAKAVSAVERHELDL